MQAKFDPAVVPNPFTPLLAAPGRETPPHRSFQRQRQRRAAILATTRRLMAGGQEQFTLRRVSDECGVTVQTIRNSFGRREDLMVSAINDHTSAVWQALGGFSSGPMLFLDLAQMYYHCASATPEFLRAMVTSAIASSQPLAVLQRHGSSIKSGHLRNMARQGMLRQGADPEALAAQITRLNTFMMYEWATSGDAAELLRQMVGGNKLLLMGALSPSVAEQVEAWMPAEAA